MRRLFVLPVLVLLALALVGFFAAREAVQSSDTVGPSAAVSTAPADIVPPPDQDPSFSVADGGPSGLYPADMFNLGPVPSVLCPALGLGCPAAVPEDDIDALSYGQDFVWPMKPYWKWLFFSVAPGSTGAAGSAVNVEANCPSPEPQADEFWSSAQAQLATNGQYYDGDGAPCGANSAPGIGLIETPTSDDLDALDEFPGPVIDHSGDGVPDLTFYSLDPTSPSLGLVAGGSPDDIFVSLVNVAGPLLYADGVVNLGLQAGDDIDALCVLDQDDLYTGEPLWFSLTAGSPTVTGSGGAIGAADVLAPNPAGGAPVVVVQETALGLTPTDDLNALKCAQLGDEADKAVTGVEYDDGVEYPFESTPLPEHPEKPGLQYVEVPADEQVVISVTSVEENLGPGEPGDALVAFYADIPLSCEGRWFDDGGFFPSDFYTLGGDPFADPFSPEQFGQEDVEPLAKKPGDDDDPAIADTFEVDLHFQTADYGITEPVFTGRRITRFFDLGCPEPGQYHFWFCNKVEPKDMIDPNIDNNVWCSEMVVESLEPPTPTPTNTPEPPTATPTATPTPPPQDPSLSLHQSSPTLGVIAPVWGPPNEADVLDANAPGPPTQGLPCGPAGLGLGLPGCAGPGTDELNAMSYGVDFTLAPPDGLHWLFFSVAPGSTGAAATAVFGEHSCIGNYPSGGAEPEADVFGTKTLNSNIQNLDGDGVACNGNGAPSVGLLEPAGDDLDALDENSIIFVNPDGDPLPNAPVYFALDSASPSIPVLLPGPGGPPSVEDVFVCDPGGIVFPACPGAPPSVYADGVAQLGLAAGDEIDALCLLESGDGEYTIGLDQMYFSLSPSSPSVTAGAYNAADILTPSPVGAPVVVAPFGAIGLMASDDVNAMKCFQELVTTDGEPDGLPDEYEGQHACLQLGVNDANVDWEPDGITGDPLTNLEEFGIGTDPCVVDTDGDGCADGEELGPNPSLGGGRDPLNPRDFFDITNITGVLGAKDQGVSGFDLNMLLAWIGAAAGGSPYDDDVNANTIKDGVELDFASISGPATGPDGGISGFDLNQMLGEIGASCAAAPN